MRVNKLESRSCNNMSIYNLLMPIGDSVSRVLSSVYACISFLSVPVIDACDHEFLLCIGAICSCVSVCMCFEDADGAYYSSVVYMSSEFVNHFSLQ